MHALAASCEELRARTGNPPLESAQIRQTVKANPLTFYDKFWTLFQCFKNSPKTVKSKSKGLALTF
jgi:hypothetical protein